MTTKRKPGPAKGAPARGHRQKAPLTPAQTLFHARWQLCPASTRPPALEMAAALGMHRETFARKIKQQGRGFTDAELEAGNALLDQSAPTIGGRPWHEARDLPLADPA